MRFIIKLFPEIMVKSKSWRERLGRVLLQNVRKVFVSHGFKVRIRFEWDKLVVTFPDTPNTRYSQVVGLLQAIPGIGGILAVEDFPLTTIEAIFDKIKPVFQDQISGKSFSVRVKRTGKHDFSSTQIERELGGKLKACAENARVQLKKPDVQIKLEIDGETVYWVRETRKGLGGFPIGTQNSVLSLLSGGFDSSVSSYEMIRRGCRVHYCFFNLGSDDHERDVKKVAQHLWQRFGQTHPVKFVTVPFEQMVDEINQNIEASLRGVVLKRMMLRVADNIAQKNNVPALLTGECVGQVASQTLINLNVIDRCSETVVLRPLIGRDKPDIIDTAREIGTLPFAEAMPEYCAAVSQKPSVKVDLNEVIAQESLIDSDLLTRIIDAVRTEDIADLCVQTSKKRIPETCSQLDAQDIILDIRPDDEHTPCISVPNASVQHMPFYRLRSQFPTLDQSKRYLLYCDRGLMSRMQAQVLLERGFENVAVFKPVTR